MFCFRISLGVLRKEFCHAFLSEEKKAELNHLFYLQVSQLMILYEEAQGGRVTGDLSQLLEAVGAAVQNLVQVSSIRMLVIACHTGYNKVKSSHHCYARLRKTEPSEI